MVALGRLDAGVPALPGQRLLQRVELLDDGRVANGEAQVLPGAVLLER
jgi:hypothetical protein